MNHIREPVLDSLFSVRVWADAVYHHIYERKHLSKQLVKLHVGVEVVEYHTPEFRNQTTGQRVHAAFQKRERPHMEQNDEGMDQRCGHLLE